METLGWIGVMSVVALLGVVAGLAVGVVSVNNETKIEYKDNPEHEMYVDFFGRVNGMVSTLYPDSHCHSYLFGNRMPHILGVIQRAASDIHDYRGINDAGLIIDKRDREILDAHYAKVAKKVQKKALDGTKSFPCPKFGSCCKGECCPQFKWVPGYDRGRRIKCDVPYCEEYKKSIIVKEGC